MNFSPCFYQEMFLRTFRWRFPHHRIYQSISLPPATGANSPLPLTSLAKLLPCATAKVKSTEALGFQWYQQSKVQFPKLDLFQTETEILRWSSASCLLFFWDGWVHHFCFFSVHFTESSHVFFHQTWVWSHWKILRYPPTFSCLDLILWSAPT